MYDLDFSKLVWVGFFAGLAAALIALGLWEILDWLFDVSITFAP